MKRISERYRTSTLGELNITPLLDLVFVLLIIFMIATPVLEQQMTINLPTARPEAAPELDPRSIKPVSVDASGRVFLERREVTVAQLEAELIRLREADPNTTVSLRADANLPYQKLVGVLDAVKGAGVKLGLANLPERP
ncbi:MAG: biopolymer transporter ExbD [Verrucomicrobiia bacterium]